MADILGLLFDKDGTLIDFGAAWLPFARRLTMEAAGRDPDRADALMRDLGYDDATGGFAPGSVFAAGSGREVVATVYPHLDGALLEKQVRLADAWAAEHATIDAVPIPGIPAALEKLRDAGYRLGIATNDSHAGAIATTGTVGITGLFDVILGYDSVPNPKPAPDMVHAFCDATGLVPAQVAVIGDNTHDLDMARAAGVGLAIAVLSGNGTRDVLVPVADAVLSSVAELPDYLKPHRT